MQKIELGAAPKTFKSKVVIPTVTGDATITMNYIYRSKTEYARFYDEVAAEFRKKAEDENNLKKSKKAEGEFSLESAVVDSVKENVDFIFKIADGWDLEYEFTVENVTLLDDRYAGAIKAIRETYELALSEGRVKN